MEKIAHLVYPAERHNRLLSSGYRWQQARAATANWGALEGWELAVPLHPKLQGYIALLELAQQLTFFVASPGRALLQNSGGLEREGIRAQKSFASSYREEQVFVGD